MTDHISFYRFVRLDEPRATAQVLREVAGPLRGTILLASEGINGMLAGEPADVDAFLATLENDVRLEALSGIGVKRSRCAAVPFRRLRVVVKSQIVAFGEPVDVPERMADVAARDVPPHEWRELIRDPNVVLVDNRNSFEYRTGHFSGAHDPGVERFRDFAAYVRANADDWRGRGVTIAMYCTGGIRCEKASPWMADLGLEVRQLQGGILNYFAQVPDADRDWIGECFVFDDRVTVDTSLRETSTTRDQIDE